MAFRLRRRSAHPRDTMGLHWCGAHMPPGAPAFLSRLSPISPFTCSTVGRFYNFKLLLL